MVSAWLRVIRIKFLLASVIAVFTGLAVNWWQTNQIEPFSALMTFAGVIFLHASVDLLNDYWDFKRGIDTKTKKTGMSGGTGVLPEGLLKPSSVYVAGLLFLVLGSVIGAYFVIMHGLIIAVLLGFAIVSIYFYSTKIVDSGLAELFVAIKGAMIVLGTFYIQTLHLDVQSALAGAIIGVLSSMVLFITSFPDLEADKSMGRKTLVILLGIEKGTIFFWLFPSLLYSLILTGVFSNTLPLTTISTAATIPILIKAGTQLKKHKISLVLPMKNTLLFSRITGALFVVSLFLG